MARKNSDGYSVQEYKKGECLPMECDDLTAVIDIGLKAVKNKHLQKYTDDEEGYNRFVKESQKYLEYVKQVNNNGTEKKLIIDIESWCVSLGITRETLRKYSNRSEEWKEFIDLFKEVILSGKKQLAMTYKIPPMVYMFDVTNNHGYHNTSEFHLQAETVEPKQMATREELIEQAKNLNIFDYDGEGE